MIAHRDRTRRGAFADHDQPYDVSGRWTRRTVGLAALGLLLVIVVIGAVVYIGGIAWLARLDVRQDETPPPETISPNLPNLRS